MYCILCDLSCVFGEGYGTPLQYSCLGKSHGRRSLVGCSPRGCEESDTTEWLHFHFSLSCIGGGNGNPLQCSCLENPRDGGAWWVAVYGVPQSWTWLKRLSSSSSSALCFTCLLAVFSFHMSSRRRGMIVFSANMFLVPVTVRRIYSVFYLYCIFSAQHTACHILVREQINSWAK